MGVDQQPTTRTVLSVLQKARVLEVGREFGVVVPATGTKDTLVEALATSGQVRFQDVLGALGRDELKAACRAHGLDDSGRARPALAARLLQAHGAGDSVPPPPIFAAREIPRYAPRPGDIVQVRHRQYLALDVQAPPAPGHHTLVQLVCLDDDNQGRRLDVLWELELGARVLQPETHGLGQVDRIDPPRHFGAYLHALKWNAVTATDARLFQAPFRAGIKLFDHQLTPLKRALSLPRANLFIADDVGLGKTIEAGLVLQELLLRQRVEFVLIVCPASISLQWRDEMERRFGLRFELYNRAFMARRRQERGFGVNPWRTHNRFIVSYPTIRRPEYRDPLLAHLGDRVRKSLLILDEAHTAAPASASKYAVDSRITKVVRDIAPRFENRLFLSATPHNGHSNSFSALLELLDPQRFTRGVPVTARHRDAVMVRRLKSDLRDIGVGDFPDRKVVQIDVGTADEPELQLARMLAEYTALMKPKKGRGQLVFINLQKRLLSSVEAFCRTLQLHAKSVGAGKAETALQLTIAETDDDEYGPDDDALEATAGAEVEAASRLLQSPEGRARHLLADMLKLAEQRRAAADAKVRSLVDWIRTNQCRAVRIGGAEGRGKDREWTDRRVIIFTEYGDTKRYLVQLLGAAIAGTDEDDARILQFHGGMSDEAREEVQRAFNSPPDQHAVRMLIATDAAREGVNLQGHCADLFHFDVPWNPARMEQRNGRIDRTLQAAPEVRCHYFFYPDRPEDMVLQRLVQKVEIIQKELGSLGAVVMDRLADVMGRGIDDNTPAALDAAEELGGRRETTRNELEAQRDDQKALREEIDEAGRILNGSRKIMEFEPVLLRDALDVGLELAGATGLKAGTAADGDAKVEAFELPELPESWQVTVDTLRPPRGRVEPFWEWRKRAPQPVVFKPPDRMNSRLCHLHLQHPFVQRILQRFLAQGWSAQDLSRVTILRTSHDSLARVIAFGRLSLFGPGATRLHDQLVSVAAAWLESGGAGHLKPFADAADRRAVDMLEQVLRESPALDRISPKSRDRLRASAPSDFAALWPHIRDEADSLAHEATRKLQARGAAEADQLREILAAQKTAIEKTLGAHQLALAWTDAEKDERLQWQEDRKYMERRLGSIDREVETEPGQIQDLYRVILRRLEPVGLVYLWPETRS
jgi:superfamily II DNA or RNA helicase